jgi:hypothetical protein
VYFEIEFPGASSIEITFHEDTDLEEGSDFISFFRDATCTASFGAKRQFSGPRQVGWPGVAGVPTLHIDHDKCFVHFHSDASVGSRGFHFTAEAPVSEDLATCLLASLQRAAGPDATAALDADDVGDDDDETIAHGSSVADRSTDLIACRLALRQTNNHYEHALAYLHSNYKTLSENARTELSTREKTTVGGIFRNRHSSAPSRCHTMMICARFSRADPMLCFHALPQTCRSTCRRASSSLAGARCCPSLRGLRRRARSVAISASKCRSAR